MDSDGDFSSSMNGMSELHCLCAISESKLLTSNIWQSNSTVHLFHQCRQIRPVAAHLRQHLVNQKYFLQ